MRIIGGKYRGKNICPPANFKARPTTDFAKEAIFTMLHNTFNIENLNVLDLFSGTGNISYEFCSRNCKSLIAIEKNPIHAKFIKSQIDNLEFLQARIIQTDVFIYLQKCQEKFDIIFADPPYTLDNIEEIYELVIKNNLLTPDSWLIIEHSESTKLSHLPFFKVLKKYGSVNLSIFEI
ncbi:MAG: 16S rRNA (guanine(966)-N(2))-methyltransferase RsmD [Bacteroidales bacterium]|jgi:16S rRNA (guanine(966)-N(2))-methyltransferase RsmD|nr:16S rRNA (guanine(966)-N(2))-methyltransferase RsmD [Bacteroidales bacterium]